MAVARQPFLLQKKKPLGVFYVLNMYWFINFLWLLLRCHLKLIGQ